MFAVGDKVVRVNEVAYWSAYCAPPKGKPLLVEAMWIDIFGDVACSVAGYPSAHESGGWLASHFRKIQPCEPEFIELLNRIKPKVDA